MIAFVTIGVHALTPNTDVYSLRHPLISRKAGYKQSAIDKYIFNKVSAPSQRLHTVYVL